MAIQYAHALAPLAPWFLEEPCPPENVDALALVARSIVIPVAAGERRATRYDFRTLLEKQACAIIQPDVCHCGGISEIRKIAAMAETYYIPIAPHNPYGPIATMANVHVGYSVTNYLIQEVIRDDVPWRYDIVDAIHGAIYYGLDGITPTFCPTYLHVDDYLNSIRFVEHLQLDTFVGCHWAIKRGAEIANFCAESRDFVDRTDLLLLQLIKEPHALADICAKLGPQLGDWPRKVDNELVYALKGHVERLEAAGKITVRREADQPNLYQIA